MWFWWLVMTFFFLFKITFHELPRNNHHIKEIIFLWFSFLWITFQIQTFLLFKWSGPRKFVGKYLLNTQFSTTANNYPPYPKEVVVRQTHTFLYTFISLSCILLVAFPLFLMPSAPLSKLLLFSLFFFNNLTKLQANGRPQWCLCSFLHTYSRSLLFFRREDVTNWYFDKP